MCNGSMVPDVMHDILEGSLEYGIKRLLTKIIYDEHYFTLKEFNSRLENMDLGYMEAKDRPSEITVINLKNPGTKLKQQGMYVYVSKRYVRMYVQGTYVCMYVQGTYVCVYKVCMCVCRMYVQGTYICM